MKYNEISKAFAIEAIILKRFVTFPNVIFGYMQYQEAAQRGKNVNEIAVFYCEFSHEMICTNNQ